MTPIQQRMLKMFIWLRVGVGLAGLSLPFILAGFGSLKYNIPLAPFMSSYYHATATCSGSKAVRTIEADASDQSQSVPEDCNAIGMGPMRNWFVGNLFFIGGALILMRGFDWFEDILLDVAGIMAPCVALFPMNWGDQHGHNPHAACAITLFVTTGLTCVFCSRTTLNEMPTSVPNSAQVIARYKLVYWLLAVVMVGAPLCAHLISALYRDPHEGFFVESAGVGAFGLYWLIKTLELKRSDLEGRAIRGEF